MTTSQVRRRTIIFALMNETPKSLDDVTVTPVLRECLKCNYSAVTDQTACPQCGRKMATASSIRGRGIFLIVVGLFLVAFMGGIALFVSNLLADAMKDPTSAKRITDEAATFFAIYLIFGVVIAFGLRSVVIGTWQVIFGKRNKVLIYGMWAILFLIIIAVGFFYGVSK